MAWQWSRSRNSYRDIITGRFTAQSVVLDWVSGSIANGQDAVTLLAEMVNPDNPALSPAAWNSAMREQIKGEYIRQYLLGRGGRDQMTAVDWGSVGGSLADQYRFLESLTEEIASGKLSEAQIRSRAQMYISSSREAYERAQGRVAAEAGMGEVKWTLDAAAEHCDDCIAFAAMGWIPTTGNPYGGCFPGTGCTVCLTRCACNLEYRVAPGV